MLVDVEHRDTSVELFGRRLPAPLLFAPIGVLELAHRDADHAVARAARALGLPMVISSPGVASRWRTSRARLGDAPRWFQLYWSKDDDVVDSFVAARRGRSAARRSSSPSTRTCWAGAPATSTSPTCRSRAAEGIAQYTSDPVFRRLVEARAAARAAASRLPRPTPAAVRALVLDGTPLPRPDCATTCARRCPAPPSRRSSTCSPGRRSPGPTWRGCASGRPCRSCSRASSTRPTPRSRSSTASTGSSCPTTAGARSTARSASLDALPGVVEVVGGRVPVLFDSGIRSGADVVTALALGATAVLVGRPWVYGLALAGADGVRAVMQHLWAELDLTMALAGVRSVDEIGPRPAGAQLTRRVPPGRASLRAAQEPAA